jgi:hypothetical protein
VVRTMMINCHVTNKKSFILSYLKTGAGVQRGISKYLNAMPKISSFLLNRKVLNRPLAKIYFALLGKREKVKGKGF